MKLIANCKSCKTEIKINSNASTRPELEMDKGELIKITCQECGLKQEKHVNDVRAIQSIPLIVGGLLISLLTTFVLVSFAGIFGVITLAVPLVIWQQQRSSAHNFNLYRTRR